MDTMNLLKDNAALEFFSFDKKTIEKIQNKKFSQLLNHHMTNNKHYASLLARHGVTEPLTLSDIQKLPFITKNEILQFQPFLSVSSSTVKRYYQTSGTSGQPKEISYTSQEITMASQLKARGFLFAGIQEGDVLLSAMAYGPWASGFITQGAGEMIGTTLAGDAKLPDEWFLDKLIRIKPSYLVAHPSFLPRLHNICITNSIDPKTISLSHIFVCGDMSSSVFKKHFADTFDCVIRDLYCCSEFSCIAAECSHGNLHYWADEAIIEIVDKRGRYVSEGEVGELVITGLWKESQPLLRYNTKDLAALVTACSCGSKIPAITQIQGRSDDMLTIAAANVFPRQIDEQLCGLSCITPMYRLTVLQEGFKDKIILDVEITDNATDVDTQIMHALLTSNTELREVIVNRKAVDVAIVHHSPDTIHKHIKKPRKIIDLRVKNNEFLKPLKENERASVNSI